MWLFVYIFKGRIAAAHQWQEGGAVARVQSMRTRTCAVFVQVQLCRHASQEGNTKEKSYRHNHKLVLCAVQLQATSVYKYVYSACTRSKCWYPILAYYSLVQTTGVQKLCEKFQIEHRINIPTLELFSRAPLLIYFFSHFIVLRRSKATMETNKLQCFTWA